VHDPHPPEGTDAARVQIDSDVDLHQAGPGRRGRDDGPVLTVIAVGGAIGAAARYLIGQLWPTPTGSFPMSTLAINVLGCALIGVLMVLITDVWRRQRLVRPFLGTGGRTGARVSWKEASHGHRGQQGSGPLRRPSEGVTWQP